MFEHEIFILFGRGLCYLGLGVYSVLLAIFWGPALVVRNVARFLRETGVDSWPRADGFITTPKVNAIHGWILDYAVGLVEYTYRVHGEYYAGTMARQFPDEQAAWDYVDSHRDEPVIVRYRDQKPEVSILLIADQGPGWMLDTGPGAFAQVWRHLCNEVRPRAGGRPERSIPYGSHRKQSADPQRFHRPRASSGISPYNADDFK